MIKERFNINYWSSWKKDLKSNKNKIYFALFLLIIATLISSLAGNYTSEIQGQYSADLILDHIHPVNLSFLFVWVYIAINVVFFAYPLFFRPQKLHVAIIMFGLLIFVRSISICLTHLVTPVTAIHVDFPWLFGNLRFQNDLFFSGHTSIPFLGFLTFKNKKMKSFMLIATITMAATVLLMHQHYSIDVFAAFFITYGIYKIGEKIFHEKLPA